MAEAKAPEQKPAASDGKTAAVTLPDFNGFEVPKGALEHKEVKPGYGPGEGSPVEGDPTVLFNPNNPISAVTRPGNASNPSNPPNTQSDKSGQEQRIWAAQQAKEKGPSPEAQKAAEDKKKKKEEVYKKIGEVLKKYDHRESEIPASSEYWNLVAEALSL